MTGRNRSHLRVIEGGMQDAARQEPPIHRLSYLVEHVAKAFNDGTWEKDMDALHTSINDIRASSRGVTEALTALDADLKRSMAHIKASQEDGTMDTVIDLEDKIKEATERGASDEATTLQQEYEKLVREKNLTFTAEQITFIEQKKNEMELAQRTARGTLVDTYEKLGCIGNAESTMCRELSEACRAAGSFFLPTRESKSS